MIVAIHQPNFLPWLGYFYKMARADHFVFHDCVPLADRTYTNRVKIKTARGPEWLTVPVSGESRTRPICAALSCDATDWRRKLVARIEANYRTCQYYQPHADRIFQMIKSSGPQLAEMNIQLIMYIAEQLGIRTPTTRSSAMQAAGAGSELNIALCRHLGADAYLSGAGGDSYQDEKEFQQAGLGLIYSDFTHPTYPQAFGDFVPGLSIVDLLFNCGPDSAAILRSGGSA